MALDVTVGTSNSESYASVAEADAYLAFRGDTSTWTAKTQTEKENLLRWARAHMDTLTFLGVKSSFTQALEWPRFNAIDQNGYAIPGDTLPKVIKNAQAELAFQLIANDWTQGLGPITNETLKVGSIDLGRESHRPFPSAVLAMLKQFLASSPNSGGRVVRG